MDTFTIHNYENTHVIINISGTAPRDPKISHTNCNGFYNMLFNDTRKAYVAAIKSRDVPYVKITIWNFIDNITLEIAVDNKSLLYGLLNELFGISILDLRRKALQQFVDEVLAQTMYCNALDFLYAIFECGCKKGGEARAQQIKALLGL